MVCEGCIMAVSRPLIENYFVGALQMRCSVVTDTASGDTIIIDGGSEPERLIAWIDNWQGRGPDWSSGPSQDEYSNGDLPKRNVVALVNTHAHFDHSGHIPDLLDNYKVKWYLHEDDNYLQSLAQSSGQRWGFEVPAPAVADEKLISGSVMSFGAIDLEILHTPGHTLGGCCLRLLIDGEADHIFVGDTLFAGSVGRTDLPDTGGDFDLLSKSIHEKLWPLDDEIIVHPGHGPLTTIGEEKMNNPFVGLSSNRGAFNRGRYL